MFATVCNTYCKIQMISLLNLQKLIIVQVMASLHAKLHLVSWVLIQIKSKLLKLLVSLDNLALGSMTDMWDRDGSCWMLHNRKKYHCLGIFTKFFSEKIHTNIEITSQKKFFSSFHILPITNNACHSKPTRNNQCLLVFNV